MARAPIKAAGGSRRGPGGRRIVVLFDDETFDALSERAVKANVTFGQQIRELVEWGLEAVEAAESEGRAGKGEANGAAAG